MRFDFLTRWCRPVQRRGTKRALAMGAVMTTVVSATCYVTCVAGGPVAGGPANGLAHGNQFRPRPTASAVIRDGNSGTFARDAFRRVGGASPQVNPFYLENVRPDADFPPPGRPNTPVSPADYAHEDATHESQSVAPASHDRTEFDALDTEFSSSSVSEFIKTSPLSVPVRRTHVAPPIRQPESPTDQTDGDGVNEPYQDEPSADGVEPLAGPQEPPTQEAAESADESWEGIDPRGTDPEGYLDATATRDSAPDENTDSSLPERVVIRSDVDGSEDRLTRLPQDDAVNVAYDDARGDDGNPLPEIHVAELGVAEDVEGEGDQTPAESLPTSGQVRAHLRSAGAVANVNDRVISQEVVPLEESHEFNTASMRTASQDPYSMVGPQTQAYAGYPGSSDVFAPQDCGGCPDSYYVHTEYLYFDREGRENVSLSTGFTVEDFDYQSGGRVTVGRRFDCLSGWEISGVGHFEWDEFNQVVGGPFNLTLGPAGGVNLSAFNGAVLHRQEYQTELDSVELLRRRWGWDVISVSQGLRYVRVEEEFRLSSINAAGDVGVLRSKTENNFAGYQLGIDLFYPTGNFTLAGKLKGGLYANLIDHNFSLVNAGVGFQNSSDSVEFGSLVETGLHSIYHVTDNLSFRAGYELWWLYGVATAPQQPGGIISPLTGRNTDADESVFYHGASVGVELIW